MKVKEWKMRFYGNTHKAGVSILLSEKLSFRKKNIARD